MKKILLAFSLLISCSLYAAECFQAKSTIWKLDFKNKKSELQNSFLLREKICKDGIYQVNSNVSFQFFNRNNKKIYELQTYLSPIVHHEKVKKDGSFEHLDIDQKPQQIVLKIPSQTPLRYKIISLNSKEKLGEGFIK